MLQFEVPEGPSNIFETGKLYRRAKYDKHSE
jgi:hypothetical protein